jgi:hypothetical protein
MPTVQELYELWAGEWGRYQMLGKLRPAVYVREKHA